MRGNNILKTKLKINIFSTKNRDQFQRKYSRT